MDRVCKINKLIILLVLNIHFFSVNSHNADDTKSFHNFNVANSIKESVEYINEFRNLKSISKDDEMFLNSFQNFLPKAINPILLQLLPQTASNKCAQDVQYLFKSLLPPSDWAMKMVDSFGKPESGIMLGNVKWLGEYDECLESYAPPLGETGVGDFHGKYCSLSVSVKLGNMTLPLSTAVCLPDSCNPNVTFMDNFNGLPINTGMPGLDNIIESILSNATIKCKSKSKELTTGAIIFITFLSIIALFVVLGSFLTALECYMRSNASKENTSVKMEFNGNAETASHDDDLLRQVSFPAWIEKIKPFLNCFCIFTNGEKILNTEGSEGQLPCLHGLRFLSMAWVIVCHCYMASLTFLRNPLETMNHIDNLSFQIIMNGFFAVDSFLVLSGFLVTYIYFKQAPKTDGKIPWIYFYIHRYIRLTPVYAIILIFYTTISPFLGSGPLWPEDNVIEECTDTWWWNLLYINNFESQSEGCMSYTWYLANDMQFYIISPLFLITLYRYPKIGYSLLGLFMSIPFTVKFALTYKYNLLPGIVNIIDYAKDLQTFLPRLMDYYDKIYTKPYCRIEAYLIGLSLAYILYKMKESNYSIKLNKIALWIGWMISSGITLACIFGLYHRELSLVETSFYNSLSRICFSLGVVWVIFVCVTGQGGAVNGILSWKPLIPLSRLTYCAYLIHPIVQSLQLGTLRTLIEFSHMNMITLYFGTLFISYAFALVASLLFESPVIRLESLLRKTLASGR